VEMKHIDGENRGSIVLYALSTCGWCKKTKALLNELGVAYDYVDVDLLTGKDLNEAQDEIERYNPRLSFPTIVIYGKETIVGFDEEKIRKAVGG